MFSWLLNGALAEGAEQAAEETAEVVEQAAEAAPTWAQTAFEKFGETPTRVWIILVVLVALAAVLLGITRTSKKWNAKMLSYGALSIALSFVLSCIRLYRMPQGGSVTPASMLPLMLFSASYGVGPGLLAGLTYGVLQYLQGGWFANVWQFALDYLLAFAAGAMMYVVVEELIPEMSEGKHSNWGTVAFSLGFVLMMILDVTLG
jgi:thiamine transporter